LLTRQFGTEQSEFLGNRCGCLLDDILFDWSAFGRSSDAFSDLCLFEWHSITGSLQDHQGNEFESFKSCKPRTTGQTFTTTTNGITIV
jgi:hypothetical protein